MHYSHFIMHYEYSLCIMRTLLLLAPAHRKAIQEQSPHAVVVGQSVADQPPHRPHRRRLLHAQLLARGAGLTCGDDRTLHD